MRGDLPGAVEGPKLLSHSSSKVGIQYLLHPIAQRHASITRRCGEAMGRSSIVGSNVSSYPIRNRHVTKMAWPNWNSWKTPNEVFENLRFVPPVYGISSPCCLLSESHLCCMWSTFHLQAWQAFPELKTYQPYPLYTRALSKLCQKLQKIPSSSSGIHNPLLLIFIYNDTKAGHLFWQPGQFGVHWNLALLVSSPCVSDLLQSIHRTGPGALEDTWRTEDPNRLHRLQRPHQYTLACS